MAARVGDGGGRDGPVRVQAPLLTRTEEGQGWGGGSRAEPHGGVPEAPLPQGGSRQPCLGVPRGPHVALERHFLEHMADICPFVQILDAPVPQPVDNVTGTLRILNLPIAELVIEVPKISCSPSPSRSLVPEPHVAEQLEVPTVSVPRGRASSTATSSSLERISARTVEQIVDISPGGSLGQGSASSADAADEDFTVFFALFPKIKKVRSWLRTRVRGCPPVAAHPRRLLSWRSRPCRTLSGRCSSWNAKPARLPTGTDALERLSGRHQLVPRSCGSVKGMRREGSGTGTGIRVSVRLTSLLFLLGEGRYRQPRAENKHCAPRRLCCVEIFFTVNSGHWFGHPRGTLLVLAVISLVQAHTG